MNALEKLFGSAARVKLMRMFFQNPASVFTPREAARAARLKGPAASREIRLLQSVGFLEKGRRVDEVARRKGKSKQKRINGFVLSETFSLSYALRNLLVSASPLAREMLQKFFKKFRSVKLVCIGGVFLDTSSREGSIDLLVVGNGVAKSSLERIIHKLEPEVGREITWAAFSAQEFDDRVAMHDKFLQDFFDSPNECLINKIAPDERAQ